MPLAHCVPQSLPCRRCTPNGGWVLLGVGTPPLPQLPLCGASPRGLAFTFAPPSLPPTPSGPVQLEGALVGRGSDQGSQQAPGGPKWAGETWPRSLLILCPPIGSPVSPFEHGIPSPPQPPLRGASPVPPPLFLPPHSPTTPHILPGHWGFLPSPQVSVVPHQCLVGALVARKREFRVLLVCHLDSAPLHIF